MACKILEKFIYSFMFLIVDFCPPKFSIYYSYLEKVPEIDINDGQQINSILFYLFLS